MPSVSELWSVRDAAEALQRAAAEGARVSIDKEGGEVVLATHRLDQVLEHEAGDLTATVESGLRVNDLNRRLGDHGQMLALDPPGNPTIGACIAGNLSGPRRHRYGTARDLVLGVTVVLPNGMIASSGGKVVKNVAGYDLAKLFCGSGGKLGFIARASLRLHPKPDLVRTVVARVESPEDAQDKARAVLRSPLVPSALDVVWPGWLAVMFEGSPRAVDAQAAAARSLLDGRDDFGSVWEEVEARQGWARGRLLFEPGQLAETLRGVDEALVRVSAGVAYVEREVEEQRDPAAIALAERVRAQFDPQRVLV